MRVHELAKELGLTSKDIIAKLAKLGVEAKNHMSTVEDDVAKKILGTKSTAPTAPAKSAKPAEEPKKQTKAAPAAAKAAPKTPVAPPAKPASTTAHKPLAPATPPPAAASKPVKHVGVKFTSTTPPTAEKPADIKPEEVKAPPPAPKRNPVTVTMPITVGDLAKTLKISVAELIKALMSLGIFANINQLLHEQIVLRVGEALSIPIQKPAVTEEKSKAGRAAKKGDATARTLRCPVVTMMGHVDHGKTSLLDAIRKSNVAAGEVGQITQHIGAYEVRRGEDKFITFLDTPGHAAFTAMRARGAMVTDVVVLVVAADDGVMPQTLEAIDHAREAGCPIVVAINKTDLAQSNPDRVRQQLQKHDLMSEEWGGKTIMVPVSAKTGKGIDTLLENLMLEAEILELKANPEATAEGVVLEGRLSKGEGSVVTVLVQTGTLRVGDPVVCGPYYGKVRALRNNITDRMEEALPGQAALLMGLDGVPQAAEHFRVVSSLIEARQLAAQKQEELRARQMSAGRHKHLSLDDLHSQIQEGKIKDFKIILKADTQGSLEALVPALERVSAKEAEVRIHIIHAATGDVNESDVMLAAASDAVILGFHVKSAHPDVDKAIEEEGIDVRHYNIIYDAVSDVTKAIEGMLSPTLKQVFSGRSEIRKIYSSSKVGTIGGAYVTKGVIGRTNSVKILRSGTVVYEGKFSALKRFKDDVKDVKEGFECGMSFTNFNDIREHDIVETYRVEKVAGKLA